MNAVWKDDDGNAIRKLGKAADFVEKQNNPVEDTNCQETQTDMMDLCEALDDIEMEDLSDANDEFCKKCPAKRQRVDVEDKRFAIMDYITEQDFEISAMV